MSDQNDQQHWYALKVFMNRMQSVREDIASAGMQSFIPSGLIPSLAFVRATEKEVKDFEQYHFHQLWVYSNRDTHKPSVIPDKEMDVFIFVCSSGEKGLLFLGEDKPEYHEGDRVRVTDGPFKGSEGHVKRIKKDRRLIVAIGGVAAVATTFIHPQFLEIVNE